MFNVFPKFSPKILLNFIRVSFLKEQRKYFWCRRRVSLIKILCQLTIIKIQYDNQFLDILELITIKCEIVVDQVRWWSVIYFVTWAWTGTFINNPDGGEGTFCGLCCTQLGEKKVDFWNKPKIKIRKNVFSRRTQTAKVVINFQGNA